ncbi:polysaccharide deacetylase family protein [Chishuiella sp.]|uniref:polysaccharide deacetylase family protein n=1 Tax=Chishuiella sp. TaxID=1969467 RepID=UPI0028AEC4C8|nr:polysaccharide deacetylase family protein [Chishuiella sp.]
MFTINNRLKSIYLLSFLLFIFSCKNESSNQKQGLEEKPTVEVNEILQDHKDSVYKVKTDTLSSNSNNEDTITEPKEEIETPKKVELDSTKQYVYLTFDDGPFKGSKNINKILTEENVRGTVFLVGYNAFTKELKQHVEDYKQNPNVDIANHTFSHANNKYKHFYSSAEGVYNDILKNETTLDIHTKYVRLPARNVWRVDAKKKGDILKDADPAADLLAKNNYYIFGWDYEWSRNIHQLDNPEKIYEGIVHRLDHNRTFEKNHLVILMHDDMFNTDQNAEKLRQLIVLLKNNPRIVLEGVSSYPNKVS